MRSPSAIAKSDFNGYHPHLTSGRSALAVFGVMWSSLQTLIPTISAAAVFFVSALFLSPADFGLLGLASGLVISIIAFSPVAFGEALVQRKVLTQNHADTVFWLTIGFGLLCFAPLVVAAPVIAGALGHADIAAILPVLAFKIPLEMAAAVPNAMIIRSMKFKLIAVRTAVATLVSVIICVAMLLSGYGYWALVVSQVAASLVSCAMAFWVSRWRPGRSVGLSALKDISGYGLFASGDRMLSMIKLDHLVLGVVGGTTMLGVFMFAQRFYAMLTQLVGGALSSVTLSLLSTLQDDQDKAVRAFGMASFVAAAVSMPMFCIVAITVPDLLDVLLDDRWGHAAFPVQLFCVAGVLAGVGVVQASLIKSQGKAQWWFYYQLAQQGTSVLVIMLTYRYGLPTLMMVLVGKSVLLWPISVIMTTRLLGCRPLDYLGGFLRPVAATLVMAGGVLSVPYLLPEAGQTAQVVLQLLVATLIYVPTILLLSRQRIAEIRQYFPRKEKPI